eukprot:4395315-Amphidinium_carterae.2
MRSRGLGLLPASDSFFGWFAQQLVNIARIKFGNPTAPSKACQICFMATRVCADSKECHMEAKASHDSVIALRVPV